MNASILKRLVKLETIDANVNYGPSFVIMRTQDESFEGACAKQNISQNDLETARVVYHVVCVESPWTENTAESWARFANFEQSQKDELILEYGADSREALDFVIRERPASSYDMEKNKDTVVADPPSQNYAV